MMQGNGLRDAYSATLDRIKALGGSKSRLGMDTLMWLSHSKQPLEVSDLCHALGVEIGSTDLDPGEHSCDRNTTGMLFGACNS